MYAMEGIGSKGDWQNVNQTNLVPFSPKYNFPAEQLDIQYKATERQVERFHPGVPVKPYSGFSNGLDGTQLSTKDSCSFEQEVYNQVFQSSLAASPGCRSEFSSSAPGSASMVRCVDTSVGSLRTNCGCLHRRHLERRDAEILSPHH